MFEKFFYFLTTFAGAGLSIFGINQVYEQPNYVVRLDLGDRLEIRDYPPVVAAEAAVSAGTRQQASETAFRLLFDYIAGGNASSRTIAMTVPVQQSPEMIAMTAPVRVDSAGNRVTMRFFLPAKLAARPPVPADPRVRIVTLAASTVAVLRFSGNATDEARAANEHALLTRLQATAWKPDGVPYFMGYDPPFTIPFLKRNEVAVSVSSR